MSEQQNIQLVQQAYAAFGRGDVESLLGTMSDDILWEPVYGASAAVPQAGRRRGKAEVAEFFKILSTSLDFEVFEPREFIAQGDRVAVLGFYRARPKSTRKTVAADWVMLFRVRDGKVTEFREFTDSAALNAAYEPVTATAAR